MCDRGVVVRLALDLSREARGGQTPPEASDAEARKRRLTWTLVIVAVVLVAAFSGYIWFLRNRRPEADLGASDAVSGGRVATRLSALLDRSYDYGWSRVERDLSPVAYGRWDPFRSLLPETVRIVPADEASPREPEPVEAGPPEPEPPKVRLTGVLKSGDKAIALLVVDGRSTIARVGDMPFYGAQVRAIDEKSITISFRETDYTYQLGGERR